MPPSRAATTDADAHAWACRVLGLDPQTDGSRSAALRRLAAADFHAPPAAVEAAYLLNGAAPARSLARCIDSEEELAARVADFCARFFDLPPDERSAAHALLSRSAAPYPHHALRLRRLAPLLGLVPAAALERLDDPARDLAERLVRAALLLPAEQAAERRRQLASMRHYAARWQSAAETIARRAPELIPLDSVWFEQLRSLASSDDAPREARRRVSRLVRGVVPSSVKPSIWSSGLSLWQAVAVALIIIGAPLLITIAVDALPALFETSNTTDRSSRSPMSTASDATWQPRLTPEDERQAVEQLNRLLNNMSRQSAPLDSSSDPLSPHTSPIRSNLPPPELPPGPRFAPPSGFGPQRAFPSALPLPPNPTFDAGTP